MKDTEQNKALAAQYLAENPVSGDEPLRGLSAFAKAHSTSDPVLRKHIYAVLGRTTVHGRGTNPHGRAGRPKTRRHRGAALPPLPNGVSSLLKAQIVRQLLSGASPYKIAKQKTIPGVTLYMMQKWKKEAEQKAQDKTEDRADRAQRGGRALVHVRAKTAPALQDLGNGHGPAAMPASLEQRLRRQNHLLKQFTGMMLLMDLDDGGVTTL